MLRTLVVGGSGRLGSACCKRFEARGDKVFVYNRGSMVLPESLNYVVFAQRHRGGDEWLGNFENVTLVERILATVGFVDEGDCAVCVVGSVCTGRVDRTQGVGYHVGKAGLDQLVRWYAKEQVGFRINCVSPAGFTGANPVVGMDEVVGAVEFFCSSLSRGVNGQRLVVDGGAGI